MDDPSITTRQTYDEIASTYAQKNLRAYGHLLDDIATFTARLRPGSIVADIGCGPGRDIAMLRERGFFAVGVDLSLGQLRAGNVGGVVQGDMARLPLRTASVDGIWCQAALLHIPQENVVGVLAEFGRTAKRGCRLCLVVAEGDGEGWERATRYGSDSARWFTYHREPALTAQLTAAGFRTRHVGREHSGRDWLTIHAERE